MTAVLSPIAKAQFFDNNGRPLVGGKLFTYVAGTTTKQPSYVDAAGITQNSNPVILDYRGECNLWVPPNVSYKYVLAPSTDTDPPTHPIWSVDNLVNNQLITLYGGVDSGTTNAYVLNFAANFTSYADGVIVYWIPSNSNTGASTININGLGVINITNSDGSILLAGEIIANQPATILIKSGAALLITPAIPLYGLFPVTWNGFATPPGATTVSYRRTGLIVSLAFAGGTGVSNSATFGVNGLPAIVRPIISNSTSVPVIGLVDNGVNLAGGMAIINSGSGSIAFYKDGTQPAWTAAGNKGFQSGNTTILTYSI